jgi:hypothetical protein
MNILIICKAIKNLTAEVAEHAEVKMAKTSGPGCRGKSGPLFHPSRKVKTAKGFQGTISALSALLMCKILKFC